MRLQRGLSLLAVTMVVAGCGRLGLGDQACDDRVRDPSPANVLAAQAVPTARYTPCFNGLDLGWDDIDFEAEQGSAGIAIQRGTDTILTAIVTASCDPAGARQVVSGYPDILKYEDIERVRADISVVVVPVSSTEVTHALELAEEWNGVDVDGHRLLIRAAPDTAQSVADRVEAALQGHDYVWIVDELDRIEGTLEMRAAGIALRRLTVDDALDEIEDRAVTAVYRGNWYFTFEGGCITYTFDAEGQLADSVAADAAANLGFYPAYKLRELGRREGILDGSD